MNVIIFNGTQKISFVNDLSIINKTKLFLAKRDYIFHEIHITRQSTSSYKEAVYIIFECEI